MTLETSNPVLFSRNNISPSGCNSGDRHTCNLYPCCTREKDVSYIFDDLMTFKINSAKINAKALSLLRLHMGPNNLC